MKEEKKVEPTMESVDAAEAKREPKGGITRRGLFIGVGSTVALLYADELSLERSERLETLETEMAQLTAAIAAAEHIAEKLMQQ